MASNRTEPNIKKTKEKSIRRELEVGLLLNHHYYYNNYSDHIIEHTVVELLPVELKPGLGILQHQEELPLALHVTSGIMKTIPSVRQSVPAGGAPTLSAPTSYSQQTT